MNTNTKLDIDAVADSIIGVLPKLNGFEQRLSLELYRLLSTGQSVPRELLAERLGATVGAVNPILDSWPGIFYDAQQRIVGYWGLSLASAYAGPHRLIIDGRILSAWCAWDTLFIPQLLGKTVDVESTTPFAGVTTMRVTPQRVERVDPADAHMSFLLPDAAAVRKDIVTSFCHFVYFFPARQSAETWVSEHPGTFVLSIAEGYEVARRKNQTQYAEMIR